MASGFIVLPDGRCFASRWSFYDEVILAIAQDLSDSTIEQELQKWLITLIPTEKDIDHIGHGPWVRASDDKIVERLLDLRRMTQEDQDVFLQAVKRAAKRVVGRFKSQNQLVECLTKLADMVDRAERGEDPLSRSDWEEVTPPKNGYIGPEKA